MLQPPRSCASGCSAEGRSATRPDPQRSHGRTRWAGQPAWGSGTEALTCPPGGSTTTGGKTGEERRHKLRLQSVRVRDGRCSRKAGRPSSFLGGGSCGPCWMWVPVGRIVGWSGSRAVEHWTLSALAVVSVSPSLRLFSPSLRRLSVSLSFRLPVSLSFRPRLPVSPLLAPAKQLLRLCQRDHHPGPGAPTSGMPWQAAARSFAVGRDWHRELDRLSTLTPRPCWHRPFRSPEGASWRTGR